MTTHHPRKSKELGTARSSYVVNPDFGYLNSQVADKTAFKFHLGAEAGVQTQLELQELSQKVTASPKYVALDMAASLESKPTMVKVEKENISFHVPAKLLLADVADVPPAKRLRIEAVKIEEETRCRIRADPAINYALRTSHWEAEITQLRHENKVNKAAAERLIHGLQVDLDRSLAAFRALQNRVEALGFRTYAVERHIDQLAERSPGHRGWKSEVGSDYDYDPDVTLADFEIVDGSQPVEMWTQGLDNALGADVEEGKEIEV